MQMDIVLGEVIVGNFEICGFRANIAVGNSRALLHHIAQLAGSAQFTAAFHRCGFCRQDLSAGRIDPTALAEAMRVLEQRNEQLVDRLTRAQAAVERMMAQLQFTSEER